MKWLMKDLVRKSKGEAGLARREVVHKAARRYESICGASII